MKQNPRPTPAGATIPGSPETVKLGSDAAARRENDFNKGWRFHLGDNPSASAQNFDDSAWTNLDLPHDFSIFQDFTASGEAESGFLPGGTGWYRKSFVLDERHAGKTFLLNFDGVYMNAAVYVNGCLVGTHNYGYTNFAFDISGQLVCDGVTRNVVAVRAVNPIPTSRWYSGSGIYRDVTLYALAPVHVDLHGIVITTPRIAAGDGTANVAVELVNDSDTEIAASVRTTVFARGGGEAASAAASVTIPAGSAVKTHLAPVVDSPVLWSIDAPSLYTLVTEVSVDGQVVDACSANFGYRWFEFNASGFHLNGKAVKLNGVCMHHDQGGLGSAAHCDAMYRQLSILKQMGANAIRTAHNPAAAQYIERCNELGLVVIEETFDGLVDAKNANCNDFSRYFEAAASSGLYGFVAGMTCAEYAARAHVKRDRNAPSVIAWSFGNEIQEGTCWTNVGRYSEICANYICWVNDADGTRPVTSGDNNRGGSQDLVSVIHTITGSDGIAGFNYANSDAALFDLLQRFGGKKNAIIASETASHTNSRGQYRSQNSNTDADGRYHLTSYDTSAVPWGITAHDSICNTYRCDGVAGEFVWTGFDYIGEPTPWNGITAGDSGRGAIPNSSYFGIVETTGFPKDSYYLYRAQWNKNATTVHLLTAWDPKNQILVDGKTPVWVYSNAPKVELYRNGALIGTTVRTAVTSKAGHTYYTYTSESKDRHICSVSNGTGADALYAVFHVAYTAGTLSAKAYDESGREIALDASCGRHTVSTPDAAAKLIATADKTQIAANGCDLVYVEIDITDENGNPDTTANNTIACTLSGPAVIAAVDNGDQATTRKFQQASVLTSAAAATINAYAGKALVILRAAGEAGDITLTLAAKGLEGQQVCITSVARDEGGTDGLISCELIRDYAVKAGTAPALDTAITGCLADGTAVNGTIAWNKIAPDVYGTAGDYTIIGTAFFDGFEALKVSARLHVIPNIVALRSISAATVKGTAPALPGTVRGILADGTLAGEFAVAWNAPEASAYDAVGKIVAVTGTATVFGGEKLDVTCTVRVAEAVCAASADVCPMADTMTRDVPSSTISITWATAQPLYRINLYHPCAHPGTAVFRYSLNGTDFLQVGAARSGLSGGSAYTLEEVIHPVALQIIFPQQDRFCVDLCQVETMRYAAALEVHAAPYLSAIAVDGAAIEGFAADVLAYTVPCGSVTAGTAVNAGITILPAHENTVRILTISEDGTAERTYALSLALQ